MKKNVDSKVIISVVALAAIVLGTLAYRTMTAPSSIVAPAAEVKASRNPRSEGGPDQEDLKRMREYNAAHPGAASSQR